MLRKLKNILPTSLFGRAILILVLPVLLMQALSIYVFYDKHLDNIERHLARALIGDIAFLTYEIQHSDGERKKEIERLALNHMNIKIHYEAVEKRKFTNSSEDPALANFAALLDDALLEDFSVNRTVSEGNAILRIKLKDNLVLKMQFSMKRIASVTASVFVFWMLGSAIILSAIATIFLRNQIRPIRKLAKAAEDFGRGIENEEFRPHGASEVRQAGFSFLAMRERIKRMMNARTEMLAAISHDLRTPLTRMKLALAMLPEQKYAKPLIGDVQDMEKMIGEYLDFAGGVSGEEAKITSIGELLTQIIGKYKDIGSNVDLIINQDCNIALFENAIRRCFYNLIDNSLRYGNYCRIYLYVGDKYCDILVDDDGIGIPPEQRELAMQPFKRLDAARNLDKSGAGLGLSIVQDIVLRHGGEMLLGECDLGGLRVHIRLAL